MKKVLMVSPEYFDVEYAINPYMTSNEGALQKIDRLKAQSQWVELKKVYQDLGYEVEVVSGVQGLPDMVFSANQSFPFWDYDNKRPSVILSNMRSEFRQKEVSHFEMHYKSKEYQIHHLENYAFEGNGDALIRPNRKQIFGGYGFRTDKGVYEQIKKITGYEILLLELKNEYFYHLDTCFSFLGEDTIAIVKEAFTTEGLQLINNHFKNILVIDLDEAKNNFAGNCHSPDGMHVILHHGSEKFRNELLENSFEIIEVNTSEYMKSGGSVFCMKMMCY